MSEAPKRPTFFDANDPASTLKSATDAMGRVVFTETWGIIETYFAARRLNIVKSLETVAQDRLKERQAQIKFIDSIICLKDELRIRREDPDRNGSGQVDSENPDDEDHREERP